MKMVLPMPSNLANSRMHWRVKHQKKQAYWKALDMLYVTRQLPSIPAAPLHRVRLRAQMYVFSIMDHDNAVARLKHAIDWLVRSGYIVDDSPKHLDLEMPTQVVDRKNQRIEIELESLETRKAG